MISLPPGQAPRSLTRNGPTWAQELCDVRRAWHANPQGAKPRAIRHRYGSDSVRRVLKTIGYKCWYCEITPEVVQVEHYRPQVIYPLLAYRWENLLFACETCNGTHKGDKFPIEPDGQTKAENQTQPEVNIDSDTPLLLHPCYDHPEDHLTFRDGRILGITHRGRVTRRVCGLHRPWLNDQRQIWLKVFCLTLESWERAKRIGDSRADGYIEDLRKMASNQGRFAGMVRVELARNGYDWRTL